MNASFELSAQLKQPPEDAMLAQARLIEFGDSMITIDSEEAMERFRQQRALVSLYLDHGYSTDNIETLLAAKDGFDAHVTSAWHMLIPFRNNSYTLDTPDAAKNYGIGFARRIISSAKIPHGHLPLIMFEGVDAAEEKFYVHFNGRTRSEIIRLIGEIADIAVDEWRNGRESADDFRRDVIDRVRQMLAREKALFVLKTIAPKVAGAIGAASDARSLLK